MKVAKLVEFSIVTRIIVTDDEKEEDVIKRASEKILHNGQDYVNYDNCVNIDDDDDVPYHPDIDE